MKIRAVAVFIIAAGFLGGLARPATAQEIVLQTPKTRKSFSLNSLKSRLKTVRITIDDPDLKKKVTYEGFALADVLRLAGLSASTQEDEMVFHCKDGYSPNTTFEKFRKHKGYLVFHRIGEKGLGLVEQGKAKLDMGPFYIVWAEGAKLGETMPWPYQLVGIEVVNFKTKYPKIYPQGLASVASAQRGFSIFKNRCLRCHSVNLEGGGVGPELNVPKNVTEYWTHQNLKAFIRNALSFRLKSKMPPFPDLTDRDINDVLSYLEFMKNHKEDRFSSPAL